MSKQQPLLDIIVQMVELYDDMVSDRNASHLYYVIVITMSRVAPYISSQSTPTIKYTF